MAEERNRALNIRLLTDEEYKKLEAKASPMPLERWARELLLAQVSEPVVYHTYRFDAYGPGPAYGFIMRTPDNMGHTIINAEEEQAHRFNQAVELVKRNEAGDREYAERILSSIFERVFLKIME